MPLFGGKSKNPTEIVKSLKESVVALEKGDAKKSEKLQEEAARNLQAMKAVLYGTAENEPQTELVAQLAQEAYNTGLIPLLVLNLAKFDFESKKDVALIFNNLLRRQIGIRSPTVEYLCQKADIIITLLRGYEAETPKEVALNCGLMLRECIRHEPLAKILLFSEEFYSFFPLRRGAYV